MNADITRILIIAGFAVAGLAFLLLNSAPPAIMLNGEPADLSTLNRDGGVWSPLEEITRLVGARVDPGKLGGYVVEWGKTESFYLPESELFRSNGRTFVRLKTLVENLNGELTRTSGGYGIEISPAHLVNISRDDGTININFDRFSSFERLQAEELDFKIRFHNVVKSRGFQKPNIENAKLIERIVLKEESLNQITVGFDFSSGLNTRIVTERGESGFLLQLHLLHDGSPEKDGNLSSVGAQNFSYNTMTRWLDGDRHVIHYLEVSDWQDNYRLTPVLANDKVGYGDTLEEMVKDNLGVAGLNANFFDPSTLTPIGLVVKNGELLSRDWGSRAAVGVSYFGELEFFRPDLDLYLTTESGQVAVQGLNRPLGADDLVAYTSHYGNMIGESRSNITVLTLDGGEVVSRSVSPPTSVRSEQIVVIGSGTERGNLASVEEGDSAKFSWNIKPYVSMLRGAVSAGPLLIKNGKTALDLNHENFTATDGLVTAKANRAVLATTADESLMFMVISDNGISLTNLPDLLNSTGLNIINAIAFDGGSSAGLVYRDGLSIKSVRGSRQIPVGLVLVPRS